MLCTCPQILIHTRTHDANMCRLMTTRFKDWSQSWKKNYNTSIRAVYKIYRPLVIQYDYFARIKERKKSVEHIYRHLTCIFSNLIHTLHTSFEHTHTYTHTNTQPNIYETRSKHTEKINGLYFILLFCLWYFDHGCCYYDCRNHSFWNSSYFKMVDVWFSSWFCCSAVSFDSNSNSQTNTCLWIFLNFWNRILLFLWTLMHRLNRFWSVQMCFWSEYRHVE